MLWLKEDPVLQGRIKLLRPELIFGSLRRCARYFSRLYTVSLLFPFPREVRTRVGLWKEGRVDMKSSIDWQHRAKPRPLLRVKTLISAGF